MSERFHIGEWYGRPFLELTDAERASLARHKVGGGAMKKTEVGRLGTLEKKEAGGNLTKRELQRLELRRPPTSALPPLETRIFGNSGQSLSRIGLGCFSMSGAYGAADDVEHPSGDRSRRHLARHLGVLRAGA